jgi:hypothetical protein
VKVEIAGHSGIYQNRELIMCVCFSFRKSFEYSREYGKDHEEPKQEIIIKENLRTFIIIIL